MDEWLKSLFDGYLSGAITLKEFNEEFIPATWKESEKWMYGVLLHIYEYTSGHWTKEELKEKIREVITKEAGYGQV